MKYYRAVSALFTQIADAQVGNTLSEQSLIGTVIPVENKIIPADYLLPGRIIRFYAGGFYSTRNPPGTLRVRIKLGTTVILDTGPKTPVGNSVDEFWSLEADIICREVGAVGGVTGHGRVIRSSSHAVDVIDDLLYLTNPIELDTTVQHNIDITAQWEVAHVSNTITCSNLAVLVIN